MTAQDAIGALLSEIRACRRCRDRPEGKPLPHEPRPVLQASSTARLAIFGQAPGVRAHASGRPFTDPSGVRLRQWLGVDEATFHDAARVAIVPMGFCFPGQDAKGADLPPRRECAEVWHDALMHRLPRVELVLAIGAYAQRYHLGRLGLGAFQKGSLSETVTRWHEIWTAREHPRVLPLPHPSWRNTGWLTRHGWFEAELVPVVRAEVRRLLRG